MCMSLIGYRTRHLIHITQSDVLISPLVITPVVPAAKRDDVIHRTITLPRGKSTSENCLYVYEQQNDSKSEHKADTISQCPTVVGGHPTTQNCPHQQTDNKKQKNCLILNWTFSTSCNQNYNNNSMSAIRRIPLIIIIIIKEKELWYQFNISLKMWFMLSRVN